MGMERNTTPDDDLYPTGLFAAHGIGLREEDANDCAAEFRVKMLPRLRDSAEATLPHFAARIRQAAWNHARDFRDALQTRRRHLVPWPE
jgi:hypothetical protein